MVCHNELEPLHFPTWPRVPVTPLGNMNLVRSFGSTGIIVQLCICIYFLINFQGFHPYKLLLIFLIFALELLDSVALGVYIDILNLVLASVFLIVVAIYYESWPSALLIFSFPSIGGSLI